MKKLPKKEALRGKGKEWFRLPKATYIQLKKSGCKESHFYSLLFGQAEANIY